MVTSCALPAVPGDVADAISSQLSSMGPEELRLPARLERSAAEAELGRSDVKVGSFDTAAAGCSKAPV